MQKSLATKKRVSLLSNTLSPAHRWCRFRLSCQVSCAENVLPGVCCIEMWKKKESKHSTFWAASLFQELAFGRPTLSWGLVRIAVLGLGISVWVFVVNALWRCSALGEAQFKMISDGSDQHFESFRRFAYDFLKECNLKHNNHGMLTTLARGTVSIWHQRTCTGVPFAGACNRRCSTHICCSSRWLDMFRSSSAWC